MLSAAFRQIFKIQLLELNINNATIRSFSKQTHFGYESVTEEEKSEKGT